MFRVGEGEINHQAHEEHEGEDEGEEPRKARKTRKKSGSVRHLALPGMLVISGVGESAHHSGK